ncbi:hypothetical protein EV385_4188 [Krasilnikovia cinnamomea]|uniref:Uncharacterized protein n=1 Tax=Krasilnikovia cinnamomea TaxID=349313 RepID=A0A4Q7ZNQ6_9ACTN|nr:hypothetical protein EV385_4188 [Krasilnikovia cinnamomea]
MCAVAVLGLAVSPFNPWRFPASSRSPHFMPLSELR